MGRDFDDKDEALRDCFGRRALTEDAPWVSGWRQFRLHFSYSTSSAWASNDSEFLDKESTFTRAGVLVQS